MKHVIVKPKLKCTTQIADVCLNDYPFCWISHRHKYIYFETPKCGSSFLKSHLPSKRLTGVVEKGVYNNYFKFSVVRNPWDRIAALYEAFFVHNLERNTKNGMIKHLFQKRLSFEEFVQHLQNPKIHNHHWASLSDFIPDDVNHVYNFDGGGLEQIAKKYNIDGAINPKKNYRSFYNDNTRKTVESLYTSDINKFNFRWNNETS